MRWDLFTSLWKTPPLLMPVGIVNPLATRPLRYLIGFMNDGGRIGGNANGFAVTAVPYGLPLALYGISIGYCNLLEETCEQGKYGPYLKPTDTARDYDENVIDPSGLGWLQYLNNQFAQRKAQGFEYIELDNPDAYNIEDVLIAIDLAAMYGLKVIAKNPHLLGDNAVKFVMKPNVYGIIVERGEAFPKNIDVIRIRANKPMLPVWFVSFESGIKWARICADRIESASFRNMGVSYSPRGEYRTSEDIIRPF